MTAHNIFVHGVPKAQPRPRMTKRGHVYNPGSAKEWKEAVKAHFPRNRKPVITGPVILSAVFFMPVPQRMKIEEGWCVPHVKKPDADNLLKAVMDSLTEAGVWKDDSLVFSSHAEKWCVKGKTGAQIIITTFTGEPT